MAFLGKMSVSHHWKCRLHVKRLEMRKKVVDGDKKLETIKGGDQMLMALQEHIIVIPIAGDTQEETEMGNMMAMGEVVKTGSVVLEVHVGNEIQIAGGGGEKMAIVMVHLHVKVVIGDEMVIVECGGGEKESLIEGAVVEKVTVVVVVGEGETVKIVLVMVGEGERAKTVVVVVVVGEVGRVKSAVIVVVVGGVGRVKSVVVVGGVGRVKIVVVVGGEEDVMEDIIAVTEETVKETEVCYMKIYNYTHIITLTLFSTDQGMPRQYEDQQRGTEERNAPRRDAWQRYNMNRGLVHKTYCVIIQG